MNKSNTSRLLFILAYFIFAINVASAQAPAGYYSTVDTSNPTVLKSTLHNIIKDHTRFPYTSSATDTWDILELAGEDVDNTNNVIALYKNATYAKVTGGNTNYNREHSWPKSYGFPNDGSGNYPYTDMHHLFIANSSYNSSRSNKPFDICTGGCTERATDVNNGRGGAGQSNFTKTGIWDVWQARQGDVARAMFYMAVRYEGGTHGITGKTEPNLELTDDLALINASKTGSNESLAYMGLLSVLIQWHNSDPVDIYEHQHNEAVYSAQGNRNPFTDHPEWVACVFELVCGGGTPDTTPPNAPMTLTGNGSVVGQIALDWFNNTEADLAGYSVYRSNTSGGTFTKLNTTLVINSAYTDSSVTQGSTYFYQVSASDNAGNESAFSTEVSVTAATGTVNIPPVASFTSNCTDLTCNFDGSASSDSDGSIASYSWSFGASSAVASNTFANAGTFAVTLTVTDNSGATSSISNNVTVTAPPVNNVLQNGVSVTGIANNQGIEQNWTMVVPAGASNLSFNISGGTGDADLYVRFGSAPTQSTYDCRPWLNGNVETCNETVQAGTYYIMLRAYNTYSGVDLVGSYTDPTNNVAPTASFTSSCSDLICSFDGSSSADSDGSIASYSWSFGGAGVNANNTFASAGSYNVTLTVTDNSGATNSTSQTVTVTAAPVNVAPTASFTSNCNNLSCSFDGSGSSDSDGTIAAYSWSIGGTGSTASKTYASAGTYNVTLTVTDNGGATNSATSSVTVTAPVNIAPSASFTSNCTDLSCSFDGANSSDSDGSIASYSWSFGATGVSASNTYTSAGTYSVTLTVTDNNGATNAVTNSVTVTSPPVNSSPIASFTSSCTDLNCSFDGANSSDSDGSIASYSWSFGATGVSASNTYASVGTYSVTLTVTDNNGATNAITNSVSVTSPPVGNVLTNGVSVSGLSASKNNSVDYTMVVPAGASALSFAISGGTGDADIYVRFGAAPTTTNYDCRPYVGGNNETCNISVAQAGIYYIMVQAYSTFSGVSLTGSYSTGGSTGQVFSSTTSVNIPDNNPTGATSNIAVDRLGVSNNLRITYNITHTYIGDLKIELIDPTGAVTVLRSNTGGSANDINEFKNINKGSTSATGTWGLRVIDGAGADTGNINSWSIEFL